MTAEPVQNSFIKMRGNEKSNQCLSRTKTGLCHPYMTRRAFNQVAHEVWNDLPIDVRNSVIALRSYYYRLAFNNNCTS